MHDGSLAPPVTARFSRKRDAIVAAATEILNYRGVKGMTLALVAERVGLITTSVTYYFKKKDELAAACFLSGIERLKALVREASAEPSASARVRRLLELYIALRARIAAGEAPPISVFSDIRALSPPTQRPTATAYAELFRSIRRLFAAPDAERLGRGQATARTQILLEQIHWLETWLPRYDAHDYDRVCDRMHDILVGGLAPPGAVWRPAPIAVAAPAAANASAGDAFLLAATRLINQRGYHGASVELISASLNVTKGSFYHHHNAKDDVVTACFERSFEAVRRAQLAARSLPGDEWLKLTSAAAALVEFQFSSAGPLLRTSALAALPVTIRGEMIAQSGRLSDRFAAMISDGVGEGSLRPVDPFIAAQMLNATLNAAADLPVLLRGVEARTAVDFYARPFFTGLTAA
ncbi:MAG TPA: TetR/AcrR family transcriptional regulator [Caulobacteraceae bacterium]|nr:TetR/AcrR family transcriptional regulator [Caulobacteraceae bacterium]